MSRKFEKLKTLLMELFQLDKPDLDFGLYRIMHAKSGEISQFLDQDLLPQVREAFGAYRSADKAELERELQELVAAIEKAGMDPGASPKVKELKARINESGVDIEALESEVYDHLYGFFRRYYHEGDFLAKRVYKPGVYAIPYEGEEVKLHWANKDQYYIKTSEYLRDYVFKLRPGDEKNPMRVHFKLVDAAEGEHGNVKESNGGRVFILAAADPISEEEGELVIRFEYRPARMEDWTESAKQAATAAASKKPPAQQDLIAMAVKRLLDPAEHEKAGTEAWRAALAERHVTRAGERADYSRLEAHIRRYAARNTFDYFIHKDLGGFLRRELDFYIKNEVMFLDDIENESAPRVEQYLSKIKVIRQIAGKIIDFLAQLEDFQKALWLKKKFVVASSWCVRMDLVPEEFYPAIAANAGQRDEWEQLGFLEDKETVGNGGLFEESGNIALASDLTIACSAMLDTSHFDEEFTACLLDNFQDLEEQTDGVFFHSENFQALSLMQVRYREKIKCIYIDPPYNTGGDDFSYKDNYQHSSWASMIVDRINAGVWFATQDAGIFVSIDENEHPHLRLYMNTVFGETNFVADMVWAAGRKNDSKLISVSHEYIVVYARNRQHLIENKVEWRQRKKGLDDIYYQYNKIISECSGDYYDMTAALKEWFKNLPDGHPAKLHKHYSHIDERGVYFPDNISWPGGGGPKYEVLHPVTKKPVRVPSRGWMTSDQEKMKRWIAENRVHFGEDERAVPCIKSYLKDREFQAPFSVFYQDGRAATKRLRHVLGSEDFGYPKDERIISDLLQMLDTEGNLVLDYFAGSGTTGHAVINLNREDGGRRKFILVEMGDYFDTVLLPRLKKVGFSPEWKDGRPKRLATAEEAERGPRIMKVVRLESYEDTLNNLETRRTKAQEDLLSLAGGDGDGGFREQYLLQYMLDVETRGSQSLLNVAGFTDPTAYTLKVKRPGSDESREVNVDLLETFNWLIGLRVEHIAAPQAFEAEFERDAEGRLGLKGRLKQTGFQGDVPWFRAVSGATPDGRKTLVIWRNLPHTIARGKDGAEYDNCVLDGWFVKQGYSSKDSEFDLIYVNGDNNLENLRQLDDTWKVRVIEEDFHRLMFDVEAG